MSATGERRIVLVANRTTSGAATNVVTTLQSELSKYTQAIFILNVTAQSGTTPTLDIYLQQELPIAGASDLALAVPTGTSIWNDVAHFTQVQTTLGTWYVALVAGSNSNGPIKDGTLAAATVVSGPMFTSLRVKEIVGGTSPSYTYTLSAILIP